VITKHSHHGSGEGYIDVQATPHCANIMCTLVLHAAAAPPCQLLLLPMLLLLPQALAGSTLGAWLTLGTRQPPRPP